MLFDSDVLIWFTRQSVPAATSVAAAESRMLSVVTVMELLQGARDKEDAKRIKDFLGEYDFQVLPLTEAIGHRALFYTESYALATGLDVADALTAATAVENNLPLCTANVRHYQAIEGLTLHRFRP